MHTLGPWKYDINKSATEAIIVDWEGYTVVELHALENSTCSSDLEDNACLIAAAPDMLNALMDFVSYFGHDNDNGLDEMLTNARAAIAKATYTQGTTA